MLLRVCRSRGMTRPPTTFCPYNRDTLGVSAVLASHMLALRPAHGPSIACTQDLHIWVILSHWQARAGPQQYHSGQEPQPGLARQCPEQQVSAGAQDPHARLFHWHPWPGSCLPHSRAQQVLDLLRQQEPHQHRHPHLLQDQASSLPSVPCLSSHSSICMYAATERASRVGVSAHSIAVWVRQVLTGLVHAGLDTYGISSKLLPQTSRPMPTS